MDKQNIIGSNIRRIRIENQIGQTELIRKFHSNNIDIIRETLVRIEGRH